MLPRGICTDIAGIRRPLHVVMICCAQKAHLKAADKPASLLCLVLSMKRVQPLTDGFG